MILRFITINSNNYISVLVSQLRVVYFLLNFPALSVYSHNYTRIKKIIKKVINSFKN